MPRKLSEDQIDRSAAAARSAMAADPGTIAEAAPAPRQANKPLEDDTFLDHYFKRIDPQVAASFNPAQLDAIKTMFGGRGVNRHAVDLRRRFAIGRNRFYLVLLIGRENRSLVRPPRKGLAAFFGYLGLALLLLVPVFGVVYLLKVLLGIDVLAAAGLPSGIFALEQPVDPALM